MFLNNFLIERVFGLDWGVGAVFDFKDSGGFNDLYAVPLSCGNLYAVVALGRVKEVALGLSAEVVVEHHKHLATQYDIGFCCVAMAVNWQRSAGKQHVD